MEDQQVPQLENNQSVSEPPVSAVPSVPTQAKKSKVGLILAIVIPILLILLGLTIFLFFLLLSNPQKSVSNKFMSAITSGDVNKALELAGGDEADRSFLQNAADSTKGTFKLEQSASRNGRSYFLYSLSNSANKYARTVVEKESGNYSVTSYVFGPSPLKLIAATADTSTNSSASVDNTSKCLVPSDAKSTFGYDIPVLTERIVTQEDIFFQPNSLEYQYPSVVAKDLNTLAAFYKQNSSKDFVLESSGSVSIQQYTQAGADFATQRATKVSNELESLGVAKDHLKVGQPVKGTPTGEDWQRRVGIKILSTCNN